MAGGHLVSVARNKRYDSVRYEIIRFLQGFYFKNILPH